MKKFLFLCMCLMCVFAHAGKLENEKLLEAVKMSHAALAKMLIRNGANVNTMSNSGYTALLLTKKKVTVEILIRRDVFELPSNINSLKYAITELFCWYNELEEADKETYRQTCHEVLALVMIQGCDPEEIEAVAIPEELGAFINKFRSLLEANHFERNNEQNNLVNGALYQLSVLEAVRNWAVNEDATAQSEEAANTERPEEEWHFLYPEIRTFIIAKKNALLNRCEDWENLKNAGTMRL